MHKIKDDVKGAGLCRCVTRRKVVTKSKSLPLPEQVKLGAEHQSKKRLKKLNTFVKDSYEN